MIKTKYGLLTQINLKTFINKLQNKKLKIKV